MKILIVGFGKIAYMPYLRMYTDSIVKDNHTIIDLVYWERDAEPDLHVPNIIDNYYVYKGRVVESEGIIKKIPKFMGYRKLAKKTIKKNEYDKLIVLHSTPAILLIDILKKYKDKYIFDYRDYTYENHRFYNKLIYKLIRNSSITFTSSRGYKLDLTGKKDIYNSYNILHDDNSKVIRKKWKQDQVIIIRYWGLIRHKNANLKFIEAISKDKRFELHYHGREQGDALVMKTYCKEKNINNVHFHGSYLPKERHRFASETHIIHNIYENDRKTINAMGNKYYDGILFKIPQICNKGSYMGTLVTENNIGIEIDLNEPHFLNVLYNYFVNINYSKLDQKCDTLLEIINSEHSHNQEIINRFIKE